MEETRREPGTQPCYLNHLVTDVYAREAKMIRHKIQVCFIFRTVNFFYKKIKTRQQNYLYNIDCYTFIELGVSHTNV